MMRPRLAARSLPAMTVPQMDLKLGRLRHARRSPPAPGLSCEADAERLQLAGRTADETCSASLSRLTSGRLERLLDEVFNSRRSRATVPSAELTAVCTERRARGREDVDAVRVPVAVLVAVPDRLSDRQHASITSTFTRTLGGESTARSATRLTAKRSDRRASGSLGTRLDDRDATWGARDERPAAGSGAARATSRDHGYGGRWCLGLEWSQLGVVGSDDPVGGFGDLVPDAGDVTEGL